MKGETLKMVGLRATDGEILAKGPGVMKGYWENPAATAESLDEAVERAVELAGSAA